MLPVFIYLQLLFSALQEPVPTFKEQVIDDQISIGYGLALGDVDGDKKPDILLADKKQIVWYRNGDWKKFIMAENLTEFDNVCIAARDLNGDGKVEVAVGAQWNPSETSDTARSGAVFYLERPADPQQRWKAVKLPHEPTVHRMRWIRTSDNTYHLVVLPLHGRGNKEGEGQGVKVLAYAYPSDVHARWPVRTLSADMHLTHNLAVVETPGSQTVICIAGKEGIRKIGEKAGKQTTGASNELPGMTYPAGEVRVAGNFFATIEPMHGNQVVVYPDGKQRTVLDSSLVEGHALGMADFTGKGSNQVVAGWRNPDKDGLVGVKIYTRNGRAWRQDWIDKNGMACEDLQVLDMNADGRPDIVASGRASRNVKVYWNMAE